MGSQLNAILELWLELVTCLFLSFHCETKKKVFVLSVMLWWTCSYFYSQFFSCPKLELNAAAAHLWQGSVKTSNKGKSGNDHAQIDGSGSEISESDQRAEESDSSEDEVCLLL